MFFFFLNNPDEPILKWSVRGNRTLTKSKAFKDPPCSVSAAGKPMRIAWAGETHKA